MSSDSGQRDPAATVEELRAAVRSVGLEVRALADRVGDLAAAVDGLKPAHEVAVPESSGEPDRGEVVVRVAPLPELAMAAVAETTLRGLPAVRQVISVERHHSQATFVLEVEEGRDLTAEMRQAMPVPIEVGPGSDGSLEVVPEWAWGTASGGAG